MGLDITDFRRVVISTLAFLSPELPYTDSGMRITLETCFHESDGLRYLHQMNNGPARGIGQCERPTFEWLTGDYIPVHQPSLCAKLKSKWPNALFDDLAGNLSLSVALVRCRYLPDPEPIPSTIEGRAAYWGRVYQTTNDPVKIQAYINNARRIK